MSPTDAVFLAALSLIVAGVALVYYPAGFMVAGCLLGALAWVHNKGGE